MAVKISSSRSTCRSMANGVQELNMKGSGGQGNWGFGRLGSKFPFHVAQEIGKITFLYVFRHSRYRHRGWAPPPVYNRHRGRADLSPTRRGVAAFADALPLARFGRAVPPAMRGRLSVGLRRSPAARVGSCKSPRTSRGVLPHSLRTWARSDAPDPGGLVVLSPRRAVRGGASLFPLPDRAANGPDRDASLPSVGTRGDLRPWSAPFRRRDRNLGGLPVRYRPVRCLFPDKLPAGSSPRRHGRGGTVLPGWLGGLFSSRLVRGVRGGRRPGHGHQAALCRLCPARRRMGALASHPCCRSE